ncbi:MAG: RluA family pseudouridine synthase [Rhodospirillales bacterium]|nr:RluA family pseudouridine synthase [Rhodospirillales bacterium]
MSNQTTYTLTVPQDKARMRLDRFLAEALPDLSRSRLKSLIESGQVMRDGGTPVTGPAAKVKAGEVYDVNVPAAIPAEPQAQAIPLNVAFEDSDLIVIDKPPDLVVHPAPGHADGTLVNALLAHCAGSLSGIGGVTRPGIVHRLDKGTSGLMVAAKNDIAHRHLAKQLETRKLERRYQALVWGVPNPAKGEIEGAIGRNPANRKKMAVVKRGGKAALTRYRVHKAFGTLASLVECRLATGRTHQIRVHLADLGYPVLGDPLYGGGAGRRLKGVSDEFRQTLKELDHQALHAFSIGFFHPTGGKKISLESKLPKYFNDLLKVLEKN